MKRLADPPPNPPQPPVKCLLVDDLDENLLVLAALLRSDDVELLQARSGAEALNLLLEHDVALALVDVQMPEMDGFELAELMRGSERTRHVPLIFITAGTWDQRRLFQGYELGAVDFLYKPIEPHVLKSKVDVFLQLHRQKQQLMADLQERTETLRLHEMFAAVLGHDLRSPLGAMIMAAHVLQRHASDDMTRELSARMLSSGQRMTRMIEDLLDLTRARLAGGIPIVRKPGDLTPVIQRVVQEQQASYPKRRAHLDATGDLLGEWDMDRLAQVASNLIGNALHHGGDAEPVEITADGRSVEIVEVTVRNAGVIDPEILPQVFEPFRSGARETSQHDGLGLGLYIARQIVLAHEGSIDVWCDGGTHTCFRIRLPRRAAMPVSAAAVAHAIADA